VSKSAMLAGSQLVARRPGFAGPGESRLTAPRLAPRKEGGPAAGTSVPFAQCRSLAEEEGEG
jgi:hypothetical protein